MSSKKARFTVNEEGKVIDSESFEERVKAVSEFYADPLKSIPPEVLDKIEKRRKFKQGKYAAKGGVGLLAFGLVSLEASKTTDLLWSFIWGLLAVVLFVVGGILFVTGLLDHLEGEP